MSNKWYIVSLSREWCECNDYGLICKHMLAVKQIVEDEFQHLYDLLPSMYEPNGFIHDLEDLSEDACAGPSEDPNGGSSASLSGGPCGGPSEGPGGDSNNEPSLNPINETELIKEMFFNISKMTVLHNIPREKYASLTTEKRNALKRAGEMFMAVFQESMGLDLRPSRIVMPREGGSITPLQENVTNTRLGHGSQRKKRRLDYEDLSGQEEVVTQSPRPSGGIKLSRRKQPVQKKRTRVKAL
jgi:hypothetical protein